MVSGGEFLIKHFYRCEDHRCYFTVQRNGLPIYMQRKLFTESFFLLAMTELFRVTGEKKYQARIEIVEVLFKETISVEFRNSQMPFLVKFGIGHEKTTANWAVLTWLEIREPTNWPYP